MQLHIYKDKINGYKIINTNNIVDLDGFKIYYIGCMNSKEEGEMQKGDVIELMRNHCPSRMPLSIGRELLGLYGIEESKGNEDYINDILSGAAGRHKIEKKIVT